VAYVEHLDDVVLNAEENAILSIEQLPSNCRISSAKTSLSGARGHLRGNSDSVWIAPEMPSNHALARDGESRAIQRIARSTVVFVGVDGTSLLSSRTSEPASEEGSHATLPTSMRSLPPLASSLRFGMTMGRSADAQLSGPAAA
jgi:hypothetical protein